MKLRLINPRSPLSTLVIPEVFQKMTLARMTGHRRKALFLPLNLAICAAVAPPGWSVEVVDECVLDEPHQPRADGVDVVALGAMTTQARRAYALADAYRRLGVTVMLGGIHPSALPHEALEHADAVSIGDAETTFPVMLNDFAAGRLKPIYEAAALPAAPIATPRKDLFDPTRYLVFNPIQTTRGCPHHCEFCTTPHIFGRSYRQRPVNDIVAEIRASGGRFFIFSDDNVAGNPTWATELFEALVPLGITWASQCDIRIARHERLLKLMRRSGCLGLILGLESPAQDVLDQAGKDYVRARDYVRYIRTIQRHGISLWGSFIFGFDTQTWRSCLEAVRFAQRLDLVMSCYIILTPYPGTPLYDRFQAEGRILTTDWDRYNGATVVFQPRRMTPEQLRLAQLAAFHEFYHPLSAFKRLKVWPLKKYSWLANLAIHRGLTYYHASRGKHFPWFREIEG